MNKALDELISYIKESPDYQACITLKKQMEESSELVGLIEEIKKMQKKYVQSSYDEKIKEQVDSLHQQLSMIPIYVLYMQHLEVVNEMICYVKDELNDYFYQVFNG